jgi:hypothetical protein
MMLKLIKKTSFEQTVIESIVRNCLFEKAIVCRPRAKSIRGIKLSFKDETSGMLWAIDGKKYIFNYYAFDTIIKIPISQEQGDTIWEKFLFTFQNNYTYEDV